MITIQGYKINKTDINEKNKHILDKLIVKPSVSKNFETTVEEYNVLRESSKYYYLPKFFGIKYFGDVPNKISYKEADLNFIGSLKQKQQKIVDEIIPIIKKDKGCILSLPCGYGKTVIALYIMCILKVRTLVLVHKSFLVDQWKERIKQFVKNYNTCDININKQNETKNNDNKDIIKIGTLQQKIVDTDHDITIGMIQSLSLRNYNRSDIKDFGLIIVDECHHIGAKVFYQCLNKTNSLYTIGLSATPYRKDGLTRIIKWYLGNYLYKIESDNITIANVFAIKFNTIDPYNFEEKKIYFKGNMIISIPKMITNLTKIKRRNELLIQILINISKDERRHIILLSERIEHLKLLQAQFQSLTKNKISTGLYIGDANPEQRKHIENNSRIIFASVAMAKEGLDISRLNTIILATPQRDIIQSIGRVMRKTNVSSENNLNPYIIDIIDDINIFLGYGKARRKLYIKNEYIIYSGNIDDNIKNIGQEVNALFNINDNKRCDLITCKDNTVMKSTTSKYKDDFDPNVMEIMI